MVPVGLLYSQVGYDLNYPMRAAVCGAADFLGARPSFSVRAPDGSIPAEGPLFDWGDKWGRRWWIADFSHLNRLGAYDLDVLDSEGQVWRSARLEVGKDLLWKQTFRHVALEQARKRAIFAQSKVGWFDAGMHWQEANSHASLIIGLTDVLEFVPGRLSSDERTLLEKQIINGCDYLALCQNRAGELGNPEGSICHEVPKWEKIILPHDASKAVVAWARAARLMTTAKAELKASYLDRARKAYAYVAAAAPPRIGFARVPRGLPEDFVVPEQFSTRDLLMQAWAALELALAGEDGYRDEFAAIAAKVIDRQICRDKAEGPYFGHFYEFAGCGYSEKAWTHGIDKGEFGVDIGATYPNYLLPLIRGCQTWPDHPESKRWHKAVQQFGYGYFQPACHANPFELLPQGYFAGQGLLNFAGLWHGMNAAYGIAAAQAAELARFLEDRAFIEIAVGNLQWIAGLNVGMTRQALAGCVMFDMDIAEDEALPVSMIFGVGQRWAGGWTTMRGSICNGFSVGEQFKYDALPTLENDAKITLTDEDWITHCGAWLSGISRLTSVKR